MLEGGYILVVFNMVYTPSSTDQKLSPFEKRKHVVSTTLAYIQQLQAQVECNTEWLDRKAQRQRYALLADLHSWYEDELRQIFKALVILAAHLN